MFFLIQEIKAENVNKLNKTKPILSFSIKFMQGVGSFLKNNNQNSYF